MPASLSVIAQRAASSLETLQASYDLARMAIQNGIPGDFVECGVYHGAQCAAMAMAIMESKQEIERKQRFNDYGQHLPPPLRRVHLFDSFAGVPEPGPHDRQWKDARHPVGQSAATLGEVHANMAEWGIDAALLAYHSGAFETTIPLWSEISKVRREVGKEPHRIAILRIDCDLYESTKLCLEHLYPLVSKGGWVIADDFALDGARKAFMDYFIGNDGSGIGPVYFQKQH